MEDYIKFVDGITSDASKNREAYLAAIERLYSEGCDVARLDTALTGLNSESGEALDLLKKLKFQGKEHSAEVRNQLVKEAGDIMFYWIELCIALGVSPAFIITKNVEKLSARYPELKFDVERSEKRDAD